MVEQQTQFSMWCILQAPLIIGSDIRSLSKEALRILTNKEAISINQDISPGRTPWLVKGKSCQQDNCTAHGPDWIQIWARQMSNSDVAVAIVNMHNTTALQVSLELETLGLSSSTFVFDIWSKQMTKAMENIKLEVAPHETKLLRLSHEQSEHQDMTVVI